MILSLATLTATMIEDKNPMFCLETTCICESFVSVNKLQFVLRSEEESYKTVLQANAVPLTLATDCMLYRRLHLMFSNLHAEH